jgi:hypothetical protein
VGYAAGELTVSDATHRLGSPSVRGLGREPGEASGAALLSELRSGAPLLASFIDRALLRKRVAELGARLRQLEAC